MRLALFTIRDSKLDHGSIDGQAASGLVGVCKTDTAGAASHSRAKRSTHRIAMIVISASSQSSPEPYIVVCGEAPVRPATGGCPQRGGVALQVCERDGATL